MSNLFFDHDDEENDESDDFFAAQESFAVEKQTEILSETLLGMDAHEQRFLKMINENRLPHAFIFHGPQGVGKCTMARRLARTVLAHVEKPVDTGPGLFDDTPSNATKLSRFDIPSDHPVFDLMESGAHPDFRLVGDVDKAEKSKSGEILIDQVREISKFLQMRASREQGWRVVILDNAERMNVKAQNALLKIFEEPPPRTLLILVTHQLGRLLSTIRSRAMDIRFSPLSDSDFESWLGRTYGSDVSAADRNWVRTLSANCPGAAQVLIQEGGIDLIHRFLALWINYPVLDEDLWLKFASDMAATEREQFAFLTRFWQWWLESLIRAKADSAYAARLRALIPDEGVFRLLADRSMTALIAARDSTLPILERTLAVALEKQQAIFSARMCIMTVD